MRLIDADALIFDFCDHPTYSATMFFKIRNRINNASTIDAVPVVRCKDCKHGEVDDPKDFPDQYYCHAGCGWNKGDFFCSYGERKDGEG